MTSTAQFLILTEADCREVLARNHVGRMAFLNQGRVDIQPIEFVLNDDWLFLRSAYGTKLAALSRTPYVAFEVDEIAGPFDWRSVVVHGTIYEIPDEDVPAVRREHAAAIAAFRALDPRAFSPADPAGQRKIVYGLRIDSLTGRLASTSRDDTYLRPAIPTLRRPEAPPTDGF